MDASALHAECLCAVSCEGGLCFGVGFVGLDNIAEHYVREHVIETKPGLARWVGTPETDETFKPDGGHHIAAVIDSGAVLRVSIRLFALRGAPAYEVNVGRHR